MSTLNKIRKAIQNLTRMGLTLQVRDFGVQYLDGKWISVAGVVDPIGACLVWYQPKASTIMQAACQVLDKDPEWIQDFLLGTDDDPDEINAAYKLGVKINKEFGLDVL